MKDPGKTIFYTQEHDYRKILITCRFIKVFLSAGKNKH